jgi:hypothetical protein
MKRNPKGYSRQGKYLKADGGPEWLEKPNGPLKK